ncbi:MAG: ATP-dependent Clp protease proteolytic subunit, partial [Mailhella sp.]|nr:ATP-dependent Clp protease proteolytic subunit [Mailhella sp.]
MQFIASPVSTLCIGQAASMGAFLLAGGAKGLRYALPHSRIMIHQPSSGYQGQITDLDIHVREGQRLKKLLNGILAENTGSTVARITAATERDNFLSAEEALKFGIIDRILTSRSDIA